MRTQAIRLELMPAGSSGLKTSVSTHRMAPFVGPYGMSSFLGEVARYAIDTATGKNFIANVSGSRKRIR